MLIEVKVMKPALLLVLFCALLQTPALAAEPMSTAPLANPVPGEFGAGNERLTVPLPPSFPEYLPNGAINLDQAWIQDGGARLYWNTIVVPRQLKMGGAYWIDPALVPQLVINPQKQPARRYYRRAKPSAAKSPAPPNAASTALKSPAIPLPVEPVPAQPVVPSPFSPAQTRQPVVAAPDAASPVAPPRLQ